MEEQWDGPRSVMLSIHSRLLSIEFPCGCTLYGQQMNYCGQSCCWFKWSPTELARAGMDAIRANLWDLNEGDASVEVFIPASDFLNRLDSSAPEPRSLN